MFLTETWLFDDDNVVIGECKPPCYSFLNFPHGGRESHGVGIGVLCKTQLHLMSLSSPVATTTFEHTLITDQSRSILFIVIYRPPPSQPNRFKTSEFLVEFKIFIGELSLLPGKPIYLGDFNVNMDELSKSEVSKFVNILSSANLHNFVEDCWL